MKLKKGKDKNIAYQRYFYLFPFLFIIDRLSKLFFVNRPYFLKNFYFFQLNFSINKNIAFGVIIPQRIIFFLIFVILFFLFVFLIKDLRKNKTNFALFLSLIIIGAVSNLLDRIKFGGVVDFIYVPHFTVFNLADIYITFGVVLWFWTDNDAKNNCSTLQILL